jgi:hypothetical protein
MPDAFALKLASVETWSNPPIPLGQMFGCIPANARGSTISAADIDPTRDGVGCSWASGLTLSPPVIVGTIAGAGSFQPYVSA